MVAQEHVSSILPHHSPIFQPVTSSDMVVTTQEEKENSTGEILIPKNVETSPTDRRVDKTLYYPLPTFLLLIAQAQRDYNWVSWTYKKYTDI